MLAVDFNEANHTFTKPQDMTDEQCSDLRVFIGNQTQEDGSELPVIISKWQPSKEDIEAINRGEGIYLSITGTILPPSCLYTENPFVTETAEV